MDLEEQIIRYLFKKKKGIEYVTINHILIKSKADLIEIRDLLNKLVSSHNIIPQNKDYEYLGGSGVKLGNKTNLENPLYFRINPNGGVEKYNKDYKYKWWKSFVNFSKDVKAIYGLILFIITVAFIVIKVCKYGATPTLEQYINKPQMPKDSIKNTHNLQPTNPKQYKQSDSLQDFQMK